MAVSVMATANTYPETECVQCGDTFEFGFNQEYCSRECLDKNRAESVYNLLKYDHRFCFGCFAKLKEVEKPTDTQLQKIDGQQSTEAVVGFQYRTEHADNGEKTIKPGVIDTVATGIVCGECGTTDHTDGFQRDFTPIEAAKRLRKRVDETREEGQHGYEFDTATFVEAWNETKDWELALGAALEK